MMSQKKEIDIRDMPGATWRDVVAAVLESCPEAVPLSYLYEKIEPYSKAQKNNGGKKKSARPYSAIQNILIMTDGDFGACTVKLHRGEI